MLERHRRPGRGRRRDGGRCGLCRLRAARAAPRDLPLAALPLLLGAHQLTEAVVWGGGRGSGVARTVWAVVALSVLPALVPLGVLLVVAPPLRARVAPFCLAGLVAAAVLAAGPASGPVTAEVRGHTLGYGVGLPGGVAGPLLIAGYLVATVGALLAGGDRLLRLLGVVVAVGAVLCAALWRLEFISTWCAFAAVVSGVLLAWVRDRMREQIIS